MRFTDRLRSMTFVGLWIGSTWAGGAVPADDFPTPPNTEKSTETPMDPAEVCRTAKLPPGFSLQVFAAEPDVQNPIGLCTDARGRVWVAENFTWAGSNLGAWDDSLRDRVIVLARGRLIAGGRPTEIRDHPRVQEVYLGTGKTFERQDA